MSLGGSQRTQSCRPTSQWDVWGYVEGISSLEPYDWILETLLGDLRYRLRLAQISLTLQYSSLTIVLQIVKLSCSIAALPSANIDSPRLVVVISKFKLEKFLAIDLMKSAIKFFAAWRLMKTPIGRVIQTIGNSVTLLLQVLTDGCGCTASTLFTCNHDVGVCAIIRVNWRSWLCCRGSFQKVWAPSRSCDCPAGLCKKDKIIGRGLQCLQ